MHTPIRLPRRVVLKAGLGLLAAAHVAPVLARQAGEMNQPDGTYLFGQGSDLMPTVPVRWRIVEQTAKPYDLAPELARTLNFLTPISPQPIHVDNLTTGSNISVPAHLAASAFGAEGEVQKRWADAAEPAPYVAFELIVADQDDESTLGTGTRLGRSSTFTAPAGVQAMEMAALVVIAYADPARPVPDFGDDYPLVGYAYPQPLTVVHADDSTTVVNSGQTIRLQNGDVVEYSGDDQEANGNLYVARFVAQRSY